MYGLVPAGAVQKPHRPQSIALDFIVDCPSGCYSLLGTQLDDAGQILNPTRIDWTPGSAFITPPGYWHAHYNESSQEAYDDPPQSGTAIRPSRQYILGGGQVDGEQVAQSLGLDFDWFVWRVGNHEFSPFLQ